MSQTGTALDPHVATLEQKLLAYGMDAADAKREANDARACLMLDTAANLHVAAPNGVHLASLDELARMIWERVCFANPDNLVTAALAKNAERAKAPNALRPALRS